MQAGCPGKRTARAAAMISAYVLSPDRTVVCSYQSLDPGRHVSNTLAAVQAWRDTGKVPPDKWRALRQALPQRMKMP